MSETPVDNSKALGMFANDNASAQPASANIDIDDLFQDCFFGGDNPLETTEFASPDVVSSDFGCDASLGQAATAAAVIANPSLQPYLSPQLTAGMKRSQPTATPASATSMQLEPVLSAATPSVPMEEDAPAASNNKALTTEQRIERRERNREHAKRSRLRKKFLLESLQDQISGLEAEIDELKNLIKREVPDRAGALLQSVGAAGKGSQKYKPLPMPSGFGPVKTLMEPDYRLMSALSGSQQNFSISDPSLPDNPIVYVSQGFLDLTGYSLDQVLGRNCRFLQGPGTDQNAVDIIRKGIREGMDTSVCLLNYKADGTPFWNQFFVAALRDAENNVVNFVGVQCEVSKARVESELKSRAAAGANA